MFSAFTSLVDQQGVSGLYKSFPSLSLFLNSLFRESDWMKIEKNWLLNQNVKVIIIVCYAAFDV